MKFPHRATVLLLFVPLLSGCDRRAEAGVGGAAAAAPTPAPAPGAALAPTPAPAPGAAPAPGGSGAVDPAGVGVSTPASPVSRIVFIGKENACACTRRAIDASWSALQAALGGAPIPVEQLTVDGTSSQVAPYREMRAFFALPALYFLDAGGGLVGQLQGEVTAEQIRAILFP